jgi:hypothetical protein
LNCFSTFLHKVFSAFFFFFLFFFSFINCYFLER